MVQTRLMLIHDQDFYESHAIDIELCLWSLQNTLTLTEGVMLIFITIGTKILGCGLN